MNYRHSVRENDCVTGGTRIVAALFVLSLRSRQGEVGKVFRFLCRFGAVDFRIVQLNVGDGSDRLITDSADWCLRSKAKGIYRMNHGLLTVAAA